LKSPKAIDEPYSHGITLSREGYVSKFGFLEGEIKEDKKSLWNAITDARIEDAEPGDEIIRALMPIKAKRKEEGTWEVDEWETPQADRPHEGRMDAPQEAIVICFDLSWSMNEALGSAWVGSPNSLTKLTESKQVFENSLGRMVGYQFLKTFIGVVTFSSRDKIGVVRELSRINRQDSFQELAKGFECNGMTELYDGIRMAKDKLVEFKANNPQAKLRIIVLTDGEDNDSTSKPAQVCRELYDAEIVLDSVIIGSSRTDELFKISKHTGGYAFKPSTRLLLFQTFLLEPFLDISTRPDIERVPVTDWSNSTPKQADMQTMYDFPPRRRDKQEAGTFISLSA
ncbi:vWA-like protein, partial [Pyrenochaeta sp. DS3sAY3a]